MYIKLYTQVLSFVMLGSYLGPAFNFTNITHGDCTGNRAVVWLPNARE